MNCQAVIDILRLHLMPTNLIRARLFRYYLNFTKERVVSYKSSNSF
nr:MAG TPA: hypothetical protein [Caudoviricetes sp.]